jgi:hypothetical protein
MYKDEEKVINGRLCHRPHSTDLWIRYTKKELTEMIKDLKSQILILKVSNDELERINKGLRNNLSIFETGDLDEKNN